MSTSDFLKNMQILGVTSGSGSNTRRTSAPTRLWGCQNTVQGGLPTTASYSNAMKVQAEGPAKRVRFFLQNASFMEFRNMRISVAPTERMGRDTLSHSWSRWENGAVSNVLASTTVPNGFRQVTWDGGSLNSSVCGSGDVVLPSFGLGNTGIIVSDWIEVGALPAVDFTMPGGRAAYAYLFKIYNPGDPLGLDAYAYVPNTYINANLGFFDANPTDYRLIMGDNMSGDCVSNPALVPSANTWFADIFPIGWEFDYGIETTSIWCVGDSITEAFRWPYMGVHRKSTLAKPWEAINIGGSSTRSKDFLQNMWSHLQFLSKPDYMMIPSMSINNYSPTSGFNQQTAQFELKRLLETADQLNQIGIKPILWTCYNFGPDTDPTFPISIVNTGVRNYCAAGKAILMDVNRDPRFVWNGGTYDATLRPLSSIAPDNTHPSEGVNGIPLFATLLSETLAPL